MKRAILVIYRNPWGDTGTRRITVVQFQDARVAPVREREGGAKGETVFSPVFVGS